MNDYKLRRLHNHFTTKVVLRKIFNAWYSTLDQLKRRRILKTSAQIMSGNSLLEKYFRALRDITEEKIRKRSILNQFHERNNYNLKSNVIMALHQNIIDMKIIKTQFYNKVVCLADKRIRPFFGQWVE